MNGKYPIVFSNSLESKLHSVQNFLRSDLEWVRNNRNSADISNYLEYDDVADLNSDENPDRKHARRLFWRKSNEKLGRIT